MPVTENFCFFIISPFLRGFYSCQVCGAAQAQTFFSLGLRQETADWPAALFIPTGRDCLFQLLYQFHGLLHNLAVAVFNLLHYTGFHVFLQNHMAKALQGTLGCCHLG